MSLGLQLTITDTINYFFCPTNSPKPQNSSFVVTNDKEKQLILTFKKLELASVWLKTTENWFSSID